MPQSQRIAKLNSLLVEVISEVVRKEVKDPRLASLVTITSVDVSRDLHYAKVYVSVIGTPEEKQKSIEALQSAAGFTAVSASKKVSLRYFPALTFKLDDSADKFAAVEELLEKIHKEQKSRPPHHDQSSDS